MRFEVCHVETDPTARRKQHALHKLAFVGPAFVGPAFVGPAFVGSAFEGSAFEGLVPTERNRFGVLAPYCEPSPKVTLASRRWALCPRFATGLAC
jgi:hypothetical protein